MRDRGQEQGVRLPQPENSYTSLKALPQWPFPQENLPLPHLHQSSSSLLWNPQHGMVRRRLLLGVCPMTDAPGDTPIWVV